MNNNNFTKTLTISLGDPSGISPYIFSKLELQNISEDCRILFWGDLQTLTKYKALKHFEISEIDISEFFQALKSTDNIALKDITEDIVIYLKEKVQPLINENNKFQFIGIKKPADFIYSEPNILSGLFSYLYFRMCLEFLKFEIDNNKDTKNALLTGPLSKEWVGRCVSSFGGHTTEMENYFNRKLIMLLTTRPGEKSSNKKQMSVIPLTTHIPLKDVPGAIQKFDPVQLGKTLLEYKDFLHLDDNHPLALLSLNPHAGEGGLIGKEEDEILEAWLDKWEEMGLAVDGPFPADGFYGSGAWKDYALILGTYHDQVLTPFKFFASELGVNISLNLPFFRISPDHGPAYNLEKIEAASSESLKISFEIAKDYLNSKEKRN